MTLPEFGRAAAAGALLASGVLLAAGPCAARAQDTLPPLSAEVRLSDFGLESADRVRRGRVSVAYAPGGPALGVYFLRDRAEVAPESPSAPLALPAIPDAAPAGGWTSPSGSTRPTRTPGRLWRRSWPACGGRCSSTSSRTWTRSR